MEDGCPSHGRRTPPQVEPEFTENLHLSSWNLLPRASDPNPPSRGLLAAPEKVEAQAFDKIYSDRGEEGRVLRQAINVAKAMPFVADLTPLVVGGVDALDDTEQSEAYRQLQQIGRDRWPTATEAQQFTNAISDPVNAELARKAHRRPTAPVGGAYPFPR
jgi:hypothetical protein